ncbi:kinase-like domain-containing protein [Mycena vulgaris]|nr:kinase-like domain-containing protein [Mycena vulgaris]
MSALSDYDDGDYNVYDEYDDFPQTQPQDDDPSAPPEVDTQPQVLEYPWGYLHHIGKVLPSIPLIGSAVSIGRVPSQTVMLPDPDGKVISKHHALFCWVEVEGKRVVVLEDASSTHGTYVGKNKIERGAPRVVSNEDVVSFGYLGGTYGKQSHSTTGFGILTGSPAEYQHKDARCVWQQYRSVTKLGEGSFGVVRSATHLVTGAEVAVSEKTTMREINVMKLLRHPNICEILDAFMDRDGTIDLVLELVRGGDLCNFIRDSPSQRLGEDACLRRILKNILLTLDDPPVVKVADFGLAKVFDLSVAQQTMCGTPKYMAPETYTPPYAYTQAVDSWSIGIIVLVMLTGMDPSPNPSEAQLMEGQSIRLEEMISAASVSEEGADFIWRLVQRNPSNRMELTDALRHPWLAECAAADTERRDSDPSSDPAPLDRALTRTDNNSPPPSLGLDQVEMKDRVARDSIRTHHLPQLPDGAVQSSNQNDLDLSPPTEELYRPATPTNDSPGVSRKRKRSASLQSSAEPPLTTQLPSPPPVVGAASEETGEDC